MATWLRTTCSATWKARQLELPVTGNESMLAHPCWPIELDTLANVCNARGRERNIPKWLIEPRSIFPAWFCVGAWLDAITQQRGIAQNPCKRRERLFIISRAVQGLRGCVRLPAARSGRGVSLSAPSSAESLNANRAPAVRLPIGSDALTTSRYLFIDSHARCDLQLGKVLCFLLESTWHGL